jgi:hypothetical protein
VLAEHLSPTCVRDRASLAASSSGENIKIERRIADRVTMRLGQAVGLGLVGFLLGGALVAIVCVALVLPMLLAAVSLAWPEPASLRRPAVATAAPVREGSETPPSHGAVLLGRLS